MFTLLNQVSHLAHFTDGLLTSSLLLECFASYSLRWLCSCRRVLLLFLLTTSETRDANTSDGISKFFVSFIGFTGSYFT